jgi:hypothetical protein
MSAWLLIRLLLLALMAAIFFFAANFEAFVYMNQFPLFRKARNCTAFFFMFLGRLAAGFFAAITGQEQKPRIEQIHQATVLVIEVFTCILVVTTLSSLYAIAVARIARRKLRDVERMFETINTELIHARDQCANLRGYASCAAHNSVQEAVAHLRQGEYRPPHVSHPGMIVAAETAYENELNNVEDDATAIGQTLIMLNAEMQSAISSMNQLQHRFSIVTTTGNELADTLTTTSKQLDQFRSALAVLRQESMERRQANAAEAEAAKRNAAPIAAEFDILQNPPHRRNIQANVVIICLVVSTAYIAWRHSQASATPRKVTSTSPSTEIALLENYFQTSEFGNSFWNLCLQIVGERSPRRHPSLPSCDSEIG